MNGLGQYAPFDASPYVDYISDVVKAIFSPLFTLHHFGEAVMNLTPQASYLQPYLQPVSTTTSAMFSAGPAM